MGGRRRSCARGIARFCDGGSSGRIRVEQIFDANDEVLGLKRLSNQLVGFHGHGFFGHGLVDHAGHQNHGRLRELLVPPNELADFIAVAVRHDHVSDDCVGRSFEELRQG